MVKANMLTRKDIATREGVSVDVLKYALDRHGIPPAQRIGMLCLYAEAQLPTIRRALQRTGQRMGQRGYHVAI